MKLKDRLKKKSRTYEVKVSKMVRDAVEGANKKVRVEKDES